MLQIPFGGAGVYFHPDENPGKVKYQAAHHKLVASALAVKAGHRIDPAYKISCMLAGDTYYPWSCNSEDVWAAIQQYHVSCYEKLPPASALAVFRCRS